MMRFSGIVTKLFRSSLLLCVCLGLYGTSAPAWAAPNDLHLHFLFDGRDLSNPENNQALINRRQKAFSNLSTELGFALLEPVLAPAETLGLMGFDFGVEFTVADIPETKDYWRRSVEDERPDTELLITRLRLRKGLGASFEVDGTVAFINGSSSFMAGFGIKWALNEGFHYFPALAIRGAINRLFSSRDMDLFTVNIDVVLSKQIPIVGTFTITPYAAFSLAYVHTTTQVLDPTPKNFNDNEDSGSGSNNFVFTPENIFGGRGSFGARFVWYFMSVTLEGSFTVPFFEGPETIASFNSKISFFF